MNSVSPWTVPRTAAWSTDTGRRISGLGPRLTKLCARAETGRGPGERRRPSGRHSGTGPHGVQSDFVLEEPFDRRSEEEVFDSALLSVLVSVFVSLLESPDDEPAEAFRASVA